MSVAPSTSSDQFTVDLNALRTGSTTITSLAGQSGSTASDLGSLVLDALSFAQIGSTVGAANTALQSSLTQALSKVSQVLQDVGQMVGVSGQNYTDADQQVAEALGGSAALSGYAASSPSDGVAALLQGHHQGDKGADISSLQQKLTDAGYDTKGVDGVWGKNTQAAVAAYERDHPDAVPAAASTPAAAADPAGWTQHYTSPNPNPAVVGHTRVGGKQVPTYDMTGQEPPATAPGGNLDSWITEAKSVLQQNGTDTSTISDHDLRELIQHESSGQWNQLNNWDVNAQHGHPSKGLMQTIDQTFNDNSVPGHRDVWNPVDNIVAGVRYGISRYGSFDQIPGVAALNRGGHYRGY